MGELVHYACRLLRRKKTGMNKKHVQHSANEVATWSCHVFWALLNLLSMGAKGTRGLFHRWDAPVLLASFKFICHWHCGVQIFFMPHVAKPIELSPSPSGCVGSKCYWSFKPVHVYIAPSLFLVWVKSHCASTQAVFFHVFCCMWKCAVMFVNYGCGKGVIDNI